MKVPAFAACLALLCPLPSQAGGNVQFLFGHDDRKTVDSLDSPWNAIGKVQYPVGTGAYAYCTGTLIAPNLVVTVAGCLMRPDGRFMPAPQIHFLAGLRRDKWLAHSTAACIVSPEGRPSGDDVALLVLKSPLKIAPAPLAQDGALRRGTAIIHAGYAIERPYVLSADERCQVRELRPGAIYTDCDSDLAQSGGPILMEINGRLLMNGVMVSNRKNANVAAPVESWRNLASEATCPMALESGSSVARR